MPPSPPRRKWALLIGIDEYPNLSSFKQLSGCVNDAEVMADLLRDRFGFADEDVTVLTNAEATRAGIRQALDRLAERVGEGDVVVLQFSGHGSKIPDLEGDEPDGLDETICPYDTTREGGLNVDITDDEIYAWLQRVTAKTPHVTLLFDCCHSGSVSRDALGPTARFLEPERRPAAEMGRTPAPATTRSASRDEGPSGWLPLGDRYVLFAGCRDHELANEYEHPESGEKHGMLSFHIARALATMPPGTTNQDLFDHVAPLVTAAYPAQHPQMEGAADREVFGVRDVAPMRSLSVKDRAGNRVTLSGGSVHGLTAGSEWTVYPQGTKTAEGGEPLGRVRVTRVGALTTEAEVIEEAEDGAVAEGTRAVESARAPGETGLRVALDVPEDRVGEGQALRDALGPVALVRLVDAGEPADVRLHLLPPRGAVGDDAPVSELGPLDTATWAAAAVGTDGRLVMPPQAADAPDAIDVVRKNLDRLGRYRLGLSLDNPSSALNGALEVRLKRQSADGSWVDAEPDTTGGETVYYAGDRLALTVTNRSERPLHLSVLNFGLDGAATVLYPPRGAEEVLKPGVEFSLGIREGELGEIHFPEGFPFVPNPAGPAADEGLDTIRVFATTAPTDFWMFEQEGFVQAAPATRSTASESGLGALLRLATSDRATRNVGRASAPGDDWTAVTRSFLLRRRPEGVALDPGGQAVALDGVTLRTPGLAGQVQVRAEAPQVGTRSLGGAVRGIDAVLAEEHVVVQRAVEIGGVEVARTRSLRGGPAIEVEVPDPGADHGQLVLYTDEAGVTTWHRQAANATRSLGTRTYVIDRAEPAPTGGPGTRSLTAAVGKKLLQVLVFPLVQEGIGLASGRYAEWWEGRKRPYGLRPFTPDDFRTPGAPALDGEAWRRLGAGRALLLVHGTFSRTHSAFGGLAPETVAELHRLYDGRVFAFDHFTLSHDPRANVEWLVQNLPEDAALDLDVVCHSRGGLVSRVLAEQQSALSLGARSLAVNKVVFVASPNDGTHLADPEHMGDLVDTYTNLLGLVPPNPVTDVLDGVVTVAKLFAVGALGGLKGLQSMRRGGDFLDELNREARQGDTRYFALSADFKPTQPGLASWAKDRLMGRIFGAENDLVVPTASVYADTDGDGVDLVPPSNRHEFDAAAGISHTTFFQDRAAQDTLLSWLQA